MLHALSSALLLASTPAPSPDPVPLRFGPAPGAVATKTFERSMELEGGELEVRMNGQEVPPEFLPELDIQVSHTSRLRLRDRYVALGGGRPTVLERTFLEIEDEQEEEQEMIQDGVSTPASSSTRGTSALEGETVLFRWDPDEEGYEASFPEREDGDPVLLVDLEEDADLRAWLPEGPVETGAEWTVPAAAFAALWEPGGDLHLEYDRDGAGGPDAAPDSVEYEGSLEARLQGVYGEGGEEVAVVSVSGEVTVTAVAPSELEEIPVVEGPGLVTFTYVQTLEGELRWSLDAGRLAGLELSADVVASVRHETDASAVTDFASTVRLEGEAVYRVEVE